MQTSTDVAATSGPTASASSWVASATGASATGGAGGGSNLQYHLPRPRLESAVPPSADGGVALASPTGAPVVRQVAGQGVGSRAAAGQTLGGGSQDEGLSPADLAWCEQRPDWDVNELLDALMRLHNLTPNTPAADNYRRSFLLSNSKSNPGTGGRQSSLPRHAARGSQGGQRAGSKSNRCVARQSGSGRGAFGGEAGGGLPAASPEYDFEQNAPEQEKASRQIVQGEKASRQKQNSWGANFRQRVSFGDRSFEKQDSNLSKDRSPKLTLPSPSTLGGSSSSATSKSNHPPNPLLTKAKAIPKSGALSKFAFAPVEPRGTSGYPGGSSGSSSSASLARPVSKAAGIGAGVVVGFGGGGDSRTTVVEQTGMKGTTGRTATNGVTVTSAATDSRAMSFSNRRAPSPENPWAVGFGTYDPPPRRIVGDAVVVNPSAPLSKAHRPPAPGVPAGLTASTLTAKSASIAGCLGSTSTAPPVQLGAHRSVIPGPRSASQEPLDSRTALSSSSTATASSSFSKLRAFLPDGKAKAKSASPVRSAAELRGPMAELLREKYERENKEGLQQKTSALSEPKNAAQGFDAKAAILAYKKKTILHASQKSTSSASIHNSTSRVPAVKTSKPKVAERKRLDASRAVAACFGTATPGGRTKLGHMPSIAEAEDEKESSTGSDVNANRAAGTKTDKGRSLSPVGRTDLTDRFLVAGGVIVGTSAASSSTAGSNRRVAAPAGPPRQIAGGKAVSAPTGSRGALIGGGKAKGNAPARGPPGAAKVKHHVLEDDALSALPEGAAKIAAQTSTRAPPSIGGAAATLAPKTAARNLLADSDGHRQLVARTPPSARNRIEGGSTQRGGREIVRSAAQDNVDIVPRSPDRKCSVLHEDADIWKPHDYSLSPGPQPHSQSSKSDALQLVGSGLEGADELQELQVVHRENVSRDYLSNPRWYDPADSPCSVFRKIPAGEPMLWRNNQYGFPSDYCVYKDDVSRTMRELNSGRSLSFFCDLSRKVIPYSVALRRAAKDLRGDGENCGGEEKKPQLVPARVLGLEMRVPSSRHDMLGKSCTVDRSNDQVRVSVTSMRVSGNGGSDGSGGLAATAVAKSAQPSCGQSQNGEQTPSFEQSNMAPILQRVTVPKCAPQALPLQLPSADVGPHRAPQHQGRDRDLLPTHQFPDVGAHSPRHYDLDDLDNSSDRVGRNIEEGRLLRQHTLLTSSSEFTAGRDHRATAGTAAAPIDLTQSLPPPPLQEPGASAWSRRQLPPDPGAAGSPDLENGGGWGSMGGGCGGGDELPHDAEESRELPGGSDHLRGAAEIIIRSPTTAAAAPCASPQAPTSSLVGAGEDGGARPRRPPSLCMPRVPAFDSVGAALSNAGTRGMQSHHKQLVENAARSSQTLNGNVAGDGELSRPDRKLGAANPPLPGGVVASSSQIVQPDPLLPRPTDRDERTASQVEVRKNGGGTSSSSSSSGTAKLAMENGKQRQSSPPPRSSNRLQHNQNFPNENRTAVNAIMDEADVEEQLLLGASSHISSASVSQNHSIGLRGLGGLTNTTNTGGLSHDLHRRTQRLRVDINPEDPKYKEAFFAGAVSTKGWVPVIYEGMSSGRGPGGEAAPGVGRVPGSAMQVPESVTGPIVIKVGEDGTTSAGSAPPALGGGSAASGGLTASSGGAFGGTAPVATSNSRPPTSAPAAPIRDPGATSTDGMKPAGAQLRSSVGEVDSGVNTVNMRPTAGARFSEVSNIQETESHELPDIALVDGWNSDEARGRGETDDQKSLPRERTNPTDKATNKASGNNIQQKSILKKTRFEAGDQGEQELTQDGRAIRRFRSSNVRRADAAPSIHPALNASVEDDRIQLYGGLKISEMYQQQQLVPQSVYDPGTVSVPDRATRERLLARIRQDHREKLRRESFILGYRKTAKREKGDNEALLGSPPAKRCRKRNEGLGTPEQQGSGHDEASCPDAGASSGNEALPRSSLLPWVHTPPMSPYKYDTVQYGGDADREDSPWVRSPSAEAKPEKSLPTDNIHSADFGNKYPQIARHLQRIRYGEKRFRETLLFAPPEKGVRGVEVLPGEKNEEAVYQYYLKCAYMHPEEAEQVPKPFLLLAGCAGSAISGTAAEAAARSANPVVGGGAVESFQSCQSRFESFLGVSTTQAAAAGLGEEQAVDPETQTQTQHPDRPPGPSPASVAPSDPRNQAMIMSEYRDKTPNNCGEHLHRESGKGEDQEDEKPSPLSARGLNLEDGEAAAAAVGGSSSGTHSLGTQNLGPSGEPVRDSQLSTRSAPSFGGRSTIGGIAALLAGAGSRRGRGDAREVSFGGGASAGLFDGANGNGNTPRFGRHSLLSGNSGSAGSIFQEGEVKQSPGPQFDYQITVKSPIVAPAERRGGGAAQVFTPEASERRLANRTRDARRDKLKAALELRGYEDPVSTALATELLEIVPEELGDHEITPEEIRQAEARHEDAKEARRIAAWTLPRATPESEQEQRRKLEQRLRKTDFSGMSADAADLLVFQQCVLAEIAKLEHSLVSGEQQPGEQTIPTCGVHILEAVEELLSVPVTQIRQDIAGSYNAGGVAVHPNNAVRKAVVPYTIEKLDAMAQQANHETDFWRRGKADTSRHNIPVQVIHRIRDAAEQVSSGHHPEHLPKEGQRTIGGGDPVEEENQRTSEGEFQLHLLEQFMCQAQGVVSEQDRVQRLREEAIRRWEDFHDYERRNNMATL